MRNFFTKRKIVIIIVGAIVAVMLGLLVGNNIANTIKARERTAEKAKIEKTVAERKEIAEKIKKVESDDEFSEEENYSEAYKEYLKLSDEEKKKVEAIPRKEKIEFSELETIKEDQKEDLGIEYVSEEDKKADDNKEVLPKKFNLKDKINVKVENQGQFGLCWDFASVKSLETNLALTKGEYYDISESHIDYMTSKLLNVGGRDENSGGYFANIKQYNEQNKGYVLEEEVPLNVYEDYEYNTFYHTPKENIYITKYAEFPTFYRYEEMSQEEYDRKFKDLQTAVKTHIMNYGSIYTEIIAPDYDMNLYMKDYKDIEGSRGGHAVSIVGWDDNYSRNNFKSPKGNVPEKDGAYIALNSWGTFWGDGGYFYISYEDCRVHSGLSGIVSVNNLSDLIDIDKLGKSARDFARDYYGSDIVSIDGNEYLRKETISKYLDLSDRNFNMEKIDEFEIFFKNATFKVNLSGNNIKSIDGLEKYLNDGVSLDLSNNEIKDISSLKDVKFSTLKLDRNDCITGYGELKIEDNLSLAYCGITSMENSDKYKDIFSLDLKGNYIEDYSEIANLKNLGYLDLSDNGIESVDPLKDILKMENLDYINLSNNKLKDISGLEEATIYSIDLSNNSEISNFEPIRKLKNTFYIVLDGCNIKDAGEIYIESITEDDIRREMELMEVDSEFFGVTYSLSNNKGITNLGQLKNASCIFLENCELGDISSLKEIVGLKNINLSHNYNLTGDLSDMNLVFITLIDCDLSDDFDLFNVKSVAEVNLKENNIKNIDKFADKVLWTLYIDSYDGERMTEDGPSIIVEKDTKEENIVIAIPDESGLEMNLANYINSKEIGSVNVKVNGNKINKRSFIIPVDEDTVVSYWSYDTVTTNITFKIDRNLDNDGIIVRYNPYMNRLKNSNTIDKDNIVVANTFGNSISKETKDFYLVSDIYVLQSRLEERDYGLENNSYIMVPEKYYSLVTQGDYSAKYTVGRMSGYDMIDVDFSEDLIPPDDFEEEFPTLKFTNRELYEIAKNYWKDLYVRADDDLLTIELKEYRECNDSGLPMYIPRRLLYDVKGISPMIKTDIYILMNMEDGMDRIEEEDLKIFESFENLQNIHIIASLDEYEEEDLIIPQDKYTVLLGDSIG